VFKIFEIQKIIEETVFSMEVEGYSLTLKETEDIRKVLIGEVPFVDQLKEYVDSAKRAGGLPNVF
jgi:hypothetical protein